MMRAMLYEAAQILLVRSAKWSWLKAWAMKIARHRGMKKAIVAAARVSSPRSNDIEPRPHGSLSIVFVRDWITKISQYPVAPKLGEEAVIVSRDTGTGGVIGIDHGAHVLRIESRR